MLEGGIKADVKLDEIIHIRDVFKDREIDYGWFKATALTETKIYLEPVEGPDV